MAVSAYPGVSLDESTSNVAYPLAASLAMYPLGPKPLVSVARIECLKGEARLNLKPISVKTSPSTPPMTVSPSRSMLSRIGTSRRSRRSRVGRRVHCRSWSARGR